MGMNKYGLPFSKAKLDRTVGGKKRAKQRERKISKVIKKTEGDQRYIKIGGLCAKKVFLFFFITTSVFQSFDTFLPPWDTRVHTFRSTGRHQ